MRTISSGWDLEELQEQSIKLAEKLELKQCEVWLEELCETAFWSNMAMFEAYGNEYDHRQVFRFNLFSSYAKDGRLVDYLKQEAKDFKEFDDSQDFPSWRLEAYRVAKRYQELGKKYDIFY